MILVVASDLTVLGQAQQILNRDRQVFLAPDAIQALELAGNLGFSVALIDLDLPGGAGFDLIRTLRRSVPCLQIIAISNATACQRSSSRNSAILPHISSLAGAGTKTVSSFASRLLIALMVWLLQFRA